MNRSRNKFFRLQGLLAWMIFSALASPENQIPFKCFPEKSGQCNFEQGQAGAILLTLHQPIKSLSAELWGKPIIFQQMTPTEKNWMAYLGPDLKQAPGNYRLKIKLRLPSGKDDSIQVPIQVLAKAYPVEELTLPKEMVEFPPEIVEQINRDNKTLIAAMSAINPVCSWQGVFLPPVPGEATGAFGARRIINQAPKNPHTGTDFKADSGQEIHAPNNGSVALIYQGYLTGNSLILDHGCGLYSIYYHLSEILVKENDPVKKGDLIAKAGASGRASGPHLHFGIRLLNSYLDPISFLQVSQMAEREISGAGSGDNRSGQ